MLDQIDSLHFDSYQICRLELAIHYVGVHLLLFALYHQDKLLYFLVLLTLLLRLLLLLILAELQLGRQRTYAGNETLVVDVVSLCVVQVVDALEKALERLVVVLLGQLMCRFGENESGVEVVGSNYLQRTVEAQLHRLGPLRTAKEHELTQVRARLIVAEKRRQLVAREIALAHTFVAALVDELRHFGLQRNRLQVGVHVGERQVLDYGCLLSSTTSCLPANHRLLAAVLAHVVDQLNVDLQMLACLGQVAQVFVQIDVVVRLARVEEYATHRRSHIVLFENVNITNV